MNLFIVMRTEWSGGNTLPKDVIWCVYKNEDQADIMCKHFNTTDMIHYYYVEVPSSDNTWKDPYL